jgi:hypothetical protein
MVEELGSESAVRRQELKSDYVAFKRNLLPIDGCSRYCDGPTGALVTHPGTLYVQHPRFDRLSVFCDYRRLR